MDFSFDYCRDHEPILPDHLVSYTVAEFARHPRECAPQSFVVHIVAAEDAHFSASISGAENLAVAIYCLALRLEQVWRI